MNILLLHVLMFEFGIKGIPFEIVESPFDEDKNRPSTSDPVEFTKWTASQKALAVVQELKKHPQSPDYVIGADTVVMLDDKIIGKPSSPDHAKQMLKWYKDGI